MAYSNFNEMRKWPVEWHDIVQKYIIEKTKRSLAPQK